MTEALKNLGASTTATPTRALPRDVRALDITVLAGGPGSEREVSLLSGQAVSDALTRVGHQVLTRDIGPDDLSALERPADFVFIALHGEFGEDGTVQAELEKRGLAYSGSGVRASQTAMDKVRSKLAFERDGIPTPPYVVVDAGNVAGFDAPFGIPAVVKPVGSGSSVDTTIARSSEVLHETVARLVANYGQALVEQYISGPELTVGVLGEQALPVCEIRTSREFYDYEAKYIDDDTQYLFDLDLPDELLQRVQALSVASHRALGCAVFSRVDWMVDAETLSPYVLEVNTIPGFTSHSLVPKAAAQVGLGFDELCQRIVEQSLERQPDRLQGTGNRP
ncbi:MAG: D-alanine--D-alanine ligase [Phycisphaerae bacterium]|jgi:D-alanine-D-alanine ligase